MPTALSPTAPSFIPTFETARKAVQVTPQVIQTKAQAGRKMLFNLQADQLRDCAVALAEGLDREIISTELYTLAQAIISKAAAERPKTDLYAELVVHLKQVLWAPCNPQNPSDLTTEWDELETAILQNCVLRLERVWEPVATGPSRGSKSVPPRSAYNLIYFIAKLFELKVVFTPTNLFHCLTILVKNLRRSHQIEAALLLIGSAGPHLCWDSADAKVLTDLMNLVESQTMNFLKSVPNDTSSTEDGADPSMPKLQWKGPLIYNNFQDLVKTGREGAANWRGQFGWDDDLPEEAIFAALSDLHGCDDLHC